ncbi:hypothetical protein ACM16X_02360 [Haloarcula japonica]|uniref:hypothetical protein n=1 Tax=Haloarcula japonica TaxID=29282 RepID=UPI0039F6CDF4
MATLLTKLLVKLDLVKSLKTVLWTPILANFAVAIGIPLAGATRTHPLSIALPVAFIGAGNVGLLVLIGDFELYKESGWDKESINEMRSNIGLKPVSEGDSE